MKALRTTYLAIINCASILQTLAVSATLKGANKAQRIERPTPGC